MYDAGSESKFPFSLLSIRLEGKRSKQERNFVLFFCKSGKASFLLAKATKREEKRKTREALSGGFEAKNEGYLMSNFLSYIEFYYITLRCTAATFTREQWNGKDENKRIHFAQSRIKFLLNFRTFTFIHPFFSLLPRRNGKFIDWSLVNLRDCFVASKARIFLFI